MNTDNSLDKYMIVKGFVNGRDANARSVYGVFVSASAPRNLLYLKEYFTYDPMDTDLPWSALFPMLDNPSGIRDPDSALAKYEKQFHSFADIQRIFESGRGRVDSKDLERKITYFCSDVLGLSVITFVEMTNVSKEDLLSLMPFLEEKLEKENAEAAPGEEPEDDNDLDTESLLEKLQEGDEEIFISCEAVLDPISGVAINDLTIGDIVACKLPTTSSLYAMFSNQHPEFDGVIEGEITGMKLNEYGTAVVALKLANGVSGAIKLSGKVRIKRFAHSDAIRKREFSNVSLEMIFAAAGVIVFLIMMAVLLYSIE